MKPKKMAQLVARDRHPLAHYKLDIIQFEAFISSMKSDNVGPTAKFHHYLFTHEPVRLMRTVITCMEPALDT